MLLISPPEGSIPSAYKPLPLALTKPTLLTLLILSLCFLRVTYMVAFTVSSCSLLSLIQSSFFLSNVTEITIVKVIREDHRIKSLTHLSVLFPDLSIAFDTALHLKRVLLPQTVITNALHVTQFIFLPLNSDYKLRLFSQMNLDSDLGFITF